MNNLTAQKNPVELGQVNWLRNYDDALAEASKTDKPVFLLFQEVPGCSNCTTYGRYILSNPLIVEAIETLFVPLAIHNNKGGHDQEVLQKYGEPSWNNPVVRIVDKDGKDIESRVADFRSPSLLLAAMIRSLKSSGKNVPEYLYLLHQEYLGDTQSDEAYLSMYCFWTGEKEIAQMDGVLSTEAGYMHGHEVVKVKFDKNATTLEELVSEAKAVKVADQVYTESNSKVKDKGVGQYRKDAQDKYYLRGSKYKFVPMTELQKTLVNSGLSRGLDINRYLSPRQIEILNTSDQKKTLVDYDLMDAWSKI